MSDTQPPFLLYEGEELIGTYASEHALFVEIEAPGIDQYIVIDARKIRFMIRISASAETGLPDKMANMLGAPARLCLMPFERESR